MVRQISTERCIRYIYMLNIDNRGEKSKHFGHSNIYYTGQTNNIVNRMIQHIKGIGSDFLNKNYRDARKTLVYVEYVFGSEWDAMQREEELKTYPRPKKELIIQQERNCLVSYKPCKHIILKKYSRRFEEIVLKLIN